MTEKPQTAETIAEICRILGVSERTVYTWQGQGAPVTRGPDGSYEIDPISRWREQRDYLLECRQLSAQEKQEKYRRELLFRAEMLVEQYDVAVDQLRPIQDQKLRDILVALDDEMGRIKQESSEVLEILRPALEQD